MNELNQQLKGLNLVVRKALYDTYLYKQEATQLKKEVLAGIDEAEKEFTERNQRLINPGHGANMVEADKYRDHYRPYKNRVESLRDIIMFISNIAMSEEIHRQFAISEDDDPSMVKNNILSAVNRLESLANAV
ncbi:hypothetical protein [Spirosoma agri]|uniref:Uncharacterized protein n=1 Tax=Spirosoma agri TaxID=1987381 RepID=A0A6M0IHM0_9BACT|nr:hypothetical protein [Spirosoma agri]NEU67766.1 hypothetical protein [Spirosoma agri]